MDSKPSDGEKSLIAYFSMEFGISHAIPTYSGGLGVLAGDTLKTFADMSLPFVGVSLLNEKGYFHQKFDHEGNQIEEPVEWKKEDYLVQLPNTVSVDIEGRSVKLKAWKLILRGNTGYDGQILFLDSNIEGNSDFDKTLTSTLYGGDRYYRLCQEMILGIGGVRMLQSLGITNIKKYHMNEGHASLLTVELLKMECKDHCSIKNEEELANVREKCVFTTHTPVAAGHDRFEYELFDKLLGDFVPEYVRAKADDGEKINMTLLGLQLSKHINGVAKRHGEVAREMFPEYHINSITNGIHTQTWCSDAFKKLFNKHIPEWNVDPFTLRYALSIPSEEVWSCHMQAKEKLINHINEKTNAGYDPLRFTIGYARRFTAYKRPDLLLRDVERLKAIANIVGDIQVVYAGKAHTNDTQGKEMLKTIIQLSKKINAENGKLKIVFLEHYDMKLAKVLVSGCDVWLNTPQRPREASGTSGMKAALNGIPHLSTLDGWWLEGHIEHLTGWSLGPHPEDPGFKDDPSPEDEANDLYNKLEQVVIPTFYGDREQWMRIMKHCIAMNASFFNTYRMAQQYIASAYLD